MNSTISYTGELVTKTLTRTKTKLNNGTSNLFNLFSSFLSSEELLLDMLPGYIMLYNTPANNIVNSPTHSTQSRYMLLNKFIDVIRQHRIISNEHVAEFRAVIDNTHLINTKEPNQNDSISAALVSKNKDSILAVVEFDVATYNIIAEGGQSHLTWTLKLCNSN